MFALQLADDAKNWVDSLGVTVILAAHIDSH